LSAAARARRNALRWVACFALIAAAHAGGLWFVAELRAKPAVLPEPVAAITMIDLEPLPPAPVPVVTPPAPPPPEPEPPKQVERVPPPPEPVKRVEPKPVVRRVAPAPEPPPMPDAVASPEPAPASAPAPVAATPPPQAAAAPPAARAPQGTAMPDWQSRVLARLERYKRYPREAVARRREGVPQVRFSIDRDGHVLSASLHQASGDRDLDAEAVDLVQRADPLPRPPDDLPGATIEIVVPVSFRLCGVTGTCRN
jgi:protein TonB